MCTGFGQDCRALRDFKASSSEDDGQCRLRFSGALGAVIPECVKKDSFPIEERCEATGNSCTIQTGEKGKCHKVYSIFGEPTIACLPQTIRADCPPNSVTGVACLLPGQSNPLLNIGQCVAGECVDPCSDPKAQSCVFALSSDKDEFAMGACVRDSTSVSCARLDCREASFGDVCQLPDGKKGNCVSDDAGFVLFFSYLFLLWVCVCVVCVFFCVRLVEANVACGKHTISDDLKCLRNCATSSDFGQACMRDRNEVGLCSTGICRETFVDCSLNVHSEKKLSCILDGRPGVCVDKDKVRYFGDVFFFFFFFFFEFFC